MPQLLPPDDRPQISERYSVALGKGASDADVIIAAGLQRNPLGVLLWRLQAEYDAARGELENTGRLAAAGESAARHLERLRAVDAAAAKINADLAFAVRRRTEDEVLAAHCMALLHLKTLPQVRREVEAYAFAAAERRRFHASTRTIAWIAGRALDVWLDPTCPTCDGTGWVSSGYEGRVAKVCDRCGNTGNRRYELGTEERSRWFGFLLLGDLQREMAEAAKGMSRLLRSNEAS